MRILYTLIWYIALPLVLARLWWRGRMEPGYRKHIPERLGFYQSIKKPTRALIWIHAVSVGETRAAEPMIRRLMEIYPQHTILLSHMTPTGRATGAQLFQSASQSGTLLQCYLPYDTPWLMQSLLAYFKPQLCILVETEVWPNLILACRRQHIPVILANARLSARSYKKALRMQKLIHAATAGICCVTAQTDADARRIKLLGAPCVTVTGNMKFDVTPDPIQETKGLQLRRQIGTRPVMVCASTREGEEQLLLDAFTKIRHPDLLLIIVPRHPQRFDTVAQLISQYKLSMVRRSQLDNTPLSGEIRVLLGDTMGEMSSYYASADLAFIGGSLLPLGGQNLIEACAAQKPVFIGPHTFNFERISEEAISAQAACRVQHAHDLFEQATALLRTPERRLEMGQRALNFAGQHRGATARTVSVIQTWLK